MALHARGAFTDGAEPGQTRHLLRLWLSPPNERELPAAYSEIMGGSLEVGKLADLIVIEDFRKQHADFWLNAESCLTMLNGEILKA